MGTPTGELFGKYRLVRRLAYGGMAEIFLGMLQGEAGFAKKVVVKRILPNLGDDPGFVAMFRDEAVIAARLNHPNVVQVHDFGHVDGTWFMALEHVDGLDLHRLGRLCATAGRTLAPADVAAIGADVARGLGYAHAVQDERGVPAQIVHRDISPHNIMVDRSGAAKIMDFGIAKAASRTARTNTGTIKGKVAYMAPEHAAGAAVDHRADQFALGLVLWELITGERHFAADTEVELLRKVLECAIRAPSAVRPEVPKALEDIVLKALNPDPEQRYPDLVGMEHDLCVFRFSLGDAAAVTLSSLIAELCPTSPANRPDRPGTLVLDATASPKGPAQRSSVCSGAPFSQTATAPIPEPPSPRAASPTAPTVLVAEAPKRRRAATRGPRTRARAVVAAAIGAAPLSAVVATFVVSWGPPQTPSPPRLPAEAEGEPVAAVATGSAHEAHCAICGEPKDTPAASARANPQPPPHWPGAGARESESNPKSSKRRSETIVAARPGRLSLRTSGPWLEVTLGPRRLGVTPLRSVAVPSGRLRLRLRNGAAQIDRFIEVDVEPNAHARRSVH